MIKVDISKPVMFSFFLFVPLINAVDAHCWSIMLGECDRWRVVPHALMQIFSVYVPTVRHKKDVLCVFSTYIWSCLGFSSQKRKVVI